MGLRGCTCTNSAGGRGGGFKTLRMTRTLRKYVITPALDRRFFRDKRLEVVPVSLDGAGTKKNNQSTLAWKYVPLINAYAGRKNKEKNLPSVFSLQPKEREREMLEIQYPTGDLFSNNFITAF